MKQIIKTIAFINVLILLTACNTISDASKTLRNEKIKTTDEFLVKKRQPLSLPPDYKELPIPNSDQNKKEGKSEINKILKIPTEQPKSSKSKSVEQSIINQIRK